MDLFPLNSSLGRLSLYEIYEDYEGPKCFSLINNLKQIFLVYWCDFERETQMHEWLYSPISEKKLDRIRRNEIPVREAFVKPEQLIYLVYTGKEQAQNSVKWVEVTELEEIYFPPVDFFLDSSQIQAVHKSATWFSELKIKKNSSNGEFPSRTVVSNILDALGILIETLMKDSTQSKPKIFPMSAVPGSFEVKLGASDEDKATIALAKLLGVLSSDKNRISDVISQYGIDPYMVKDLLDISNTQNVSLTFSPKFYSENLKSISIDGKKKIEIIQKLEESTNVLISSALVPQANDLEKVIEVTERRLMGEKLTCELIDGLTSDRQVKYYTDAAYCLGLMNKNLSVTSAGRFLTSRDSDVSKYQVLADRFESSEFGYGWMKWSGVKSMEELDPNTAVKFIKECVKGLSEDTAKRRSTTLIKWLKVLVPHRRAYKQ